MLFDGMPSALAEDLSARHAAMAERLNQAGVEALLLATNTNVYYATGRLPDGFFYLNDAGEARLFLRRPQIWRGKGVAPIKHPAQIPQLLEAEGLKLPKSLMLEEDALPYAEYAQLLSIFGLEKAAPNFMRKLRSIKTPYEQLRIMEACAWHADVQREVPFLYRRRMTDREFIVEIEHHYRKRGHLGKFRTYGHRMEAFMGSLLAGDNGAAPSPFDFALGGQGEHPILPFGNQNRAMRPGETVMVDISGSYNGYLSDLSRTYCIGAIPQRARDAHAVSLEIMREIARLGLPGTPVCDLYAAAMDIVKAHGLEHCFMGRELQSKFVGHGLGLEINEPPVLTPKDTTQLQPGMAIALEPKFVLDGIGPVGAENTYLVTEHGLELLTGGVEEALVELG